MARHSLNVANGFLTLHKFILFILLKLKGLSMAMWEEHYAPFQWPGDEKSLLKRFSAKMVTSEAI
jgi:hypothetical protein